MAENNEFDGKSSLNGDAKILLRLLEQRFDMFEKNISKKIDELNKMSDIVNGNTRDIAVMKARDCNPKIEGDLSAIQNQLSVAVKDISDLEKTKDILVKTLLSVFAFLFAAIAVLVEIIIRSGLI